MEFSIAEESTFIYVYATLDFLSLKYFSDVIKQWYDTFMVPIF